MTWHFMRTGWPNVAAIFALALVPIVALALQRADLPVPGTTTIELTEHLNVGEAERPPFRDES
jgi:hypothetical protein